MDDTTNLDALVADLNAGAERSTNAAQPRRDQFHRWLQAAVDASASDLFLIAGGPPSLRIEGRVTPIGESVLGGDEIEEIVLSELPAHAARQFVTVGIADASIRGRDGSRFRINLHRERGRAAATLRRLPASVPRLASLGLPPGVDLLSRLPRGLVLIGGATGSGKTTTMAALVHEINLREDRHIITIEDPIEYEHRHVRSLVEQIEIGVDAPDFPTALRAALRQSPDVIVVGEMRDPETIRVAVAAGETGHLVFSSLHTTDVASTVARIGDSFPPERQNTIRQELAMSLAAVFTQTLMPKIGGGRIPAAEMLLISYGGRQHVRKNALQHLHQEIALTKKHGSFSFEESLAGLVRQGAIDRLDAITRAQHPDELESLLR